MTHRNSKYFSPKRVGETISLTFDYVQALASGETISTSNWSVEVVEGVDGNPSAMLAGAPGINGTKVSHLIQGGIDGVLYCIIGSVDTSLGQTIEGTGLLEVNDNC